MKLPIYDNRTIVGYATSVKSAERYLRKILSIHPKMVLSVGERTEFMQEYMQSGPGYVYTISYSWGK